MQLPTMKVPVEKCLALATFSARMLGKFPQRPHLQQLSQRMLLERNNLAAAEELLQRLRREMLALRVDVSFEDYTSDNQIRRTGQMAQLADGYKGGRIASQVLPNGTRDITRRQGEKQVEGMIDLESRLEAARDIWPEAEAEQQAVAERRTAYQDVLAARSHKQREIRAAQAARDAAKERFLDTYVEIANLVKAEFPRDRRHADLFFDTVRVRGRDEQEGDDDGPLEEPDDEPAEQSAE